MKQDKRMPSGLINVGNSCYLSSVLQCLASAGDPLISHFRFCDNPVTSALSDLLDTVNCGERRRVSPSGFIKSFVAGSMGLSPEQQDAHEFLLALLNIKRRRRKLCDSIKVDNDSGDKSIMKASEPFTGVLMQELICLPCASKKKLRLRHISSLRIEPFSCITLTTQTGKISEAVYKNFFVPERFADYSNYKMDGEMCGIGAVNQKRPLIFPHLLFLHVSLLTGGSFTKSQQMIETEVQLSGPGYCYKLLSIIVHYGESGLAGHFVCYRRLGKKKWIECSDETVKIVSENVVIMQRAYILLYERTG